MPRPHKRRRVCRLPVLDSFGPRNPDALDATGSLVMTVEEFECIRWIDVEGLKQEDCAEIMGVARTTVQKIYNDARRKLGHMLVYGQQLSIRGGNFELCEDLGSPPECMNRCRRHRGGRTGFTSQRRV